MRILIVEDEVKIREGMAKLIKAHTQHTVVGEAVNGQEGLELIFRFKPDLVITDIRMPVMDGLEMIEQLYEAQVKLHMVILSGYSEFDYAKRALRYGVDDYLLKPLSAEDIQDVLKRIENKLEQEDEKNSGTPEQYLKEIIFNGAIPDVDNRKYLEEICGFSGEASYQLFFAYTGEASVIYEQEAKERFIALREQYSEVKLYVVSSKTARQMVCLTISPLELSTGERIIQSFERKLIRPYKQKEEKAVWAMVTADHYEKLPEAMKTAEELVRESISLKEGALITEAYLNGISWKEFQFPSSVTNELKNAICREQLDKITEWGEAFIQYIEDGPYPEKEIRQAYLKGIYLLLDTIRDIHADSYDQLKNANLLTLLTEAVTLHEMEQCFRDGISLLAKPQRVREDISNYTIKRAINYIREHYQEGITLEEVSGQLGITPEYLSTLFNREMKVNFSTFLRQFRISHAKRLLKGTDLKVYEIAEKVGYSDSKYFARVFKEELGVSPGDYRDME